VSEAVEFDVLDAGPPRLDGQEGGDQVEQGADPSAEQASAVVPVPGWTQKEAAQVIGGMVAGLTTALYVVKHQAPPPAELVPYIAGNPEQEFPLLGMSLAPILDMLAPKGSPQAIGVGLGAGLSEVMTAIARRVPVINTPPPKAQQGPAPAAERPAPAAASDGEGFRFKGDALHVLQRAETPLEGFGIQ
jgi:hypothetical protein